MKSLYPNENNVYTIIEKSIPKWKNVYSITKSLYHNRKSLYIPKWKMSTPKYGKFNQNSKFQWKSLYPNGKAVHSVMKSLYHNESFVST